MNVIVDQDTCISCGACISISPDVYRFNSDEKAEPITNPVASNLVGEATEGRDSCPVDAIDLKE